MARGGSEGRMTQTGEELDRAIEAIRAIADECERRAARSDLVLGPDYFVEDGRRTGYRVSAARLRRLLRELAGDGAHGARRALEHRLDALAQHCMREASEACLCFDEREGVLAGRGRAEALRTVARGLEVLGDRVPLRMAG